MCVFVVVEYGVYGVVVFYGVYGGFGFGGY